MFYHFKNFKNLSPSSLKTLVIVLFFLFSCFKPTMLFAGYDAIHIDETVLTKKQQNRRNITSYTGIITANTTYVAATVAGFVPEPVSSWSGELTALIADNTLKFMKPVLYAPQDIQHKPNAEDNCQFEFELPQTIARWDNILGLWPKLGDDALFNPLDEPTSFGLLGEPIFTHANTEADLSIFMPSALTPVLLSTEPQNIIFEAGVHTIEWRGDTLWFPIWDTVFPTVLTAGNIASEIKWSKYLTKLKKYVPKKSGKAAKKGSKTAFKTLKANSKKLIARLNKLNDKINIFAKIKKAVKKFSDKHPTAVFLTNTASGINNEFKEGDKQAKREDIIKRLAKNVNAELLVEAMFAAQNTVSRSRLQTLTIYDVIPPTLSTLHTELTFEASDPGGAKAFRYIDDMQSNIMAFDGCGRPFNLVNDAPEYFPIGDTLVTWVISDLGPALPGIDHNDDGIIDSDNFFSRSVTQLISIKDTQAPLLIAPPAVVLESDASIDLNNLNLGLPLVVDLADLHPTVSNSTNSIDGVVTPNTRTLVTWSATDHATTPNITTAEQLVTVKTIGSNTAPTVLPQHLDTLSSKSIDIVLTGNDPDLLPMTGAFPNDPLVADPVKFKIQQAPNNGEFIAPLYPYFIDDYRTDTTGVLTDDLAFAQSNNQLNWLSLEYCAEGKPGEVPLNFIFNPLFVHVTDSGEQYFLDSYVKCDPNGNGSPEIESKLRISRWDNERNFIGHIDYNPSQGQHNNSFVLDRDGKIYYLLSFGANEYSLQVCDSNILGTDGSCSAGFNYNENDGGIEISSTKYARVDSRAVTDVSDPLVYLTDGQRVNIYQGHLYKGQLVNDVGSLNFLENNGVCQPISGGGSNQAYGMEVDSKGNFYIADTCGDRIHKFLPSTIDSSGNLNVGEYVGWLGQCLSSTNLACNDEQKTSKGFSCTDLTCNISTDGSGSGDGQFLDPVYLALDPNDVLYVADYGNQRVQRFAADGTFSGQAKSAGNGINAEIEGGFVLGNMGPPRHVSVNSKQFFVVDQNEKFVHVFDASPFKDITDTSATVTYVSEFAFHSDTDTFTYSVNDGLVDSNIAMISIDVARNYRQPIPTAQQLTVDEDRSLLIILSGSDPDGILDRDFNGLDSLVFSITKQPQFGSLTLGGDAGDLLIDPGQQIWTYQPNRDFNGQDNFSFTVTDEFTDLNNDGATLIPEPYTVANSADIVIDINSVNDVPIVRISAPERIAAGFPIMIEGSVSDDISEEYFATLNWGDGQIDHNGETIVDDKGTIGDTSDDTTTITGVIFSEDGLTSIGESLINAIKTYNTVGVKEIELCMQDKEYLESCSTITALVESLVVLSGDVVLSEDEVADGVSFDAQFNVKNAVPANGVTGLNADNVSLTIEIPQELLLLNYTTDIGSCAVKKESGQLDQLLCNFGDMSNGASAIIDTTFRGQGTLIYSDDIDIIGDINTDSDAFESTVLSTASILLRAVDLDRDSDGLPNIFEAFYNVVDPNTDDDNDGLSNIQEFEFGTSPIDADSDDDGINDGDEVNMYATDPTDADSDADGVSDGDEITLYFSNPLATDSDEDGLSDQWEIDNDFDLIIKDSDDDTDNDGLTDLEEFEQGTDYQVTDTDGDTLSDGDEVNIYKTSPLLMDSDEDEVDDNLELDIQTDPLKFDSDDDGLADGKEVSVYFSNPLNSDSDSDGLPDGWETRHNRNLLLADYQLAAGGLSTCAKTDNGINCWGQNNLLQAPTKVAGLNNPKYFSMGFAHGCAIDVSAEAVQTVSCWGDNTYGQLTPPSLVNPIEISTGSYHSCAIDKINNTTSEVKCWGRDDLNQVTNTPTKLEQPTNLVSSLSGRSNCVIDNKSTGAELICWGQYNNENSAIPSQINNPLSPLSLGSEHGCIVDQGNQQCWGLNADGQAPIEQLVSNSVQLSLGGFHSCSLNLVADKANKITCWGRIDHGRTLVPTSLNEPLHLAAGSHHSCALDQGKAICWGQNGSQQAPLQRFLNIDPDGDTVITAIEIIIGTNPLDADSDRDGLTDDLEIELQINPLNSDSDNDGVSDGDEINIYASNPFNDDSDADGLPDGWEIEHGLSATTSDANIDSDSDGLNNRAEFLNSTSPVNSDSDGDGLNDGAELSIFRFIDSGESIGNNNSAAVELGDIDSDGDLDALIANLSGGSRIWNNDGEGHFTINTATIFNDLSTSDVALIDIDGDDDLDIYFAHDSDPDSLWINGGHDDPQGIYNVSGEIFSNSKSKGVAVGEFNPIAQWPGLFIAENGMNRNLNFNNNQIIEGSVYDPISANSSDVAVGDLNGDGVDDVFVANYNQSNQVLLSDIEEASPVLIVNKVQSLGNQLSNAVTLGDLDGDGDLDAFVANNQSDYIWFNNGSGIFSDSGQRLGAVSDNDISVDVALFDLDGDGDLDALVANDTVGLPDLGALKVWFNDGLGVMTNSNLIIGSSASRGMKLGDVDNDGLADVFMANEGANTIWLLKRLDPTTPDTDSDGAYDSWELDNGFDPINENDGEFDTDNDGLSNAEEFIAGTDPRNSDTDNDGMSDGWEVDNALTPLLDDSDLDLDGDGLSNLNEYQQGNNPEADDVAPVVIAPNDLQTNSTGVLTAVATGNASAIDARDGIRIPQVNNLGPYTSGSTSLLWTATDISGNIGSDNQTINVVPQVNFSANQIVGEGSNATVLIELNGFAVTYPVSIQFSVSGDANNPEDHNAISGITLIESGTQTKISIDIVDDELDEDNEQIILTIDNINNAVVGEYSTHTITIIPKNIKPTADILVSQQNKRVTTITKDGGLLSVSTNINDPNPNDNHLLDWSFSDNGIFNKNNTNNSGYELDPYNLTTGLYQIILKIEDDGIPVERNTVHSLLKVITATPNLSNETDTDNDGVDDASEGLADTDGDGVPDYLDANNALNILALNKLGYLLETQPGYILRLGEKAFTNGWYSAVSESSFEPDIEFEYPSDIADFELSKISLGESVLVVIPLVVPANERAEYKLFINGDWHSFVNDDNNQLYSAQGSPSACPAPGSIAFVNGLQAGSYCVQLLIQDGGLNDTDGEVNGEIGNTHGLAVPVEINLENILTENNLTVAKNSQNNIVFRLRFQSDSGGAELNSLMLQVSGSGSPQDIKGVNVYIDENNNGSVEENEVNIGSGQFIENNEILELHMTKPYVISVGVTNLLVTYDF